jgi:hypothetical protein
VGVGSALAVADAAGLAAVGGAISGRFFVSTASVAGSSTQVSNAR